MAAQDSEIEELVRRAGDGEEAATEALLARYRDRLRRMVAVRMDPRLAARFDASDVVQEALVKASRKLPTYLRDQPLPFYPWLRQIAWEQLVDAHRRHVRAQKRAVGRQRWHRTRLDRSTMALADRLLDTGTSPSKHLERDELYARMRTAMDQLPRRAREILVLRHLEQLSTRETAAVMGMTEGAVKTQHLRALQRLRSMLNNGLRGEAP
jgi:RNA polymerase sigma-70 factor (ECF subfamily)